MPASELYSDILSPGNSSTSPSISTPAPDDDDGDTVTPMTGVEYSLVDPDSGVVVAKSDRAQLDLSARQTLSMEDIEQLKRDATDAGKDLIAKLMLSHTALDQKTQYALAKYKLLKTRKYIRRFCVLPLDVPMLDHWLLEEKDPSKILDMREEMIALLGCWANVHFSGEDRCEKEKDEGEGNVEGQNQDHNQNQAEKLPTTGRWLVIDDTGGILTAAMAERMGILYPPEKNDRPLTKEPSSPRLKRKELSDTSRHVTNTNDGAAGEQQQTEDASAKTEEPPQEGEPAGAKLSQQVASRPHAGHKHRHDDMHVPYARTNTLTMVHSNTQPNLSYLRYFDYDHTNPHQHGGGGPGAGAPAGAAAVEHPLARHLMTLSWLQLLEPEADAAYSTVPAEATAEELRSWKASRRGTYHRKRRRWARVRHVVDTARAGGFAGLVVATSMDPISVLRHAVPLLAGGAPVAVYSQTVEPLAALADCYSIARRAAWAADPPTPTDPAGADSTPATAAAAERDYWPGTPEFPLNPSLLLGAAVQTARARRWQVLPGRTHPLMTSRGGPEGYVFTAWKVRPAEGKVEARGKARPKPKKRKAGE